MGDGDKRQRGVGTPDLVEDGSPDPGDLGQVDEEHVHTRPDDEWRCLDERTRANHFEPVLFQVGPNGVENPLIFLENKNSHTTDRHLPRPSYGRRRELDAARDRRWSRFNSGEVPSMQS